MSSPSVIADLLWQAYVGEPGAAGTAWHGPSVRMAVQGVSARDAARHVDGVHSIWELALHIATWDDICRRRLEGEAIAITTGDPGDWPASTGASEDAWARDLDRLYASQERLVDAVRRLPAERLPQQAAGCSWTNHTMIHGTLHHDLYHAGQIRLLRRLLESGAA